MSDISNVSSNLNWRKSKRSMNNGNCAEISSAGGVVMVRDTKDKQGAMLRYPAASWLGFIREARVGGFDRLRLQLLVVGRLESNAGLLHCFRAAFLVVGNP